GKKRTLEVDQGAGGATTSTAAGGNAADRSTGHMHRFPTVYLWQTGYPDFMPRVCDIVFVLLFIIGIG
ncbi:hypothetical protein NDU88_009125, partial [Pleurodeles waltl]